MSIFTNLFDSAVNLYKGVKGGAKLTNIIGDLYANLPSIVTSVLAVTGTDDEGRIRGVWQEFRDRTGIDKGAYDLINDLPPEVEEKMFNGLADFGEEMTLYAAGFYGTAPNSAEFNSVFSRMSSVARLEDDSDDEKETLEAPFVFNTNLYQQLQTISVAPERFTAMQTNKVFAKALMTVIERVS